jgi:hypothetical protein
LPRTDDCNKHLARASGREANISLYLTNYMTISCMYHLAGDKRRTMIPEASGCIIVGMIHGSS